MKHRLPNLKRRDSSTPITATGGSVWHYSLPVSLRRQSRRFKCICVSIPITLRWPAVGSVQPTIILGVTKRQFRLFENGLPEHRISVVVTDGWQQRTHNLEE